MYRATLAIHTHMTFIIRVRAWENYSDPNCHPFQRPLSNRFLWCLIHIIRFDFAQFRIAKIPQFHHSSCCHEMRNDHSFYNLERVHEACVFPTCKCKHCCELPYSTWIDCVTREKLDLISNTFNKSGKGHRFGLCRGYRRQHYSTIYLCITNTSWTHALVLAIVNGRWHPAVSW